MVDVGCKQELWIREETCIRVKYLNKWGVQDMEIKRKNEEMKQKSNSLKITNISSKKDWG